MIVSINPSYFCNFRCNFCYLTEEQLSDNKLLDLDILDARLKEISSKEKIEHIDLYGGEVGLLPKNYFSKLKIISKKYNPNVILNLITNLSMVNEITQDPDCYTSVSYDFDCREQHDRVFKNMMLLSKPFSILLLAGSCLIQKDVDEMIQILNLIDNLESVEIKPYSSNQANQHSVSFLDYEEFVKRWIVSKVPKKFTFMNENLIQDSLSKLRNSFSDDHIYITPSGKYAVLEFDLNDNEFFLEYDSLDKYYEWCEKEKIRVKKNKFCSNCDYFGNCLSEHLREVKSLENSCNGFKNLITWYKSI
jgi:sulfatase maturation enzyme AslB (radical SAM superfamily)